MDFITGGTALESYGAITGGGLIARLGIASGPLLPAVPSAIGKLQKLGISLEEANQIVESPTNQKLIDNLNSGNINIIQKSGRKTREDNARPHREGGLYRPGRYGRIR